MSDSKTGPSLTLLVDVTHGREEGRAALEGAAEASLLLGMPLAVVGDEHVITDALQELPHDAELLRVIDAPAAEEGAAPDEGSGLLRALRIAGTVEGAIAVTAAPRARVIAHARREIELLPGVERPAMAAVYPTLRPQGDRQDPFGLLLDVGANRTCDPEDLRRFAVMGACYARIIRQTEEPRVALLANSRDPDGVPDSIRVAHVYLERAAAGFTYVGLQNPSRVILGEAEVLVCDGYSGELVIRALEGLALTAEELIAQAGTRLRWKMGVSMLGAGIDTLREFTDWDNYGGSPVLGLRRPVIVVQPNAGRPGFVNACRLAARIHREDVWTRIRRSLETYPWFQDP